MGTDSQSTSPWEQRAEVAARDTETGASVDVDSLASFHELTARRGGFEEFMKDTPFGSIPGGSAVVKRRLEEMAKTDPGKFAEVVSKMTHYDESRRSVGENTATIQGITARGIGSAGSEKLRQAKFEETGGEYKKVERFVAKSFTYGEAFSARLGGIKTRLGNLFKHDWEKEEVVTYADRKKQAVDALVAAHTDMKVPRSELEATREHAVDLLNETVVDSSFVAETQEEVARRTKKIEAIPVASVQPAVSPDAAPTPQNNGFNITDFILPLLGKGLDGGNNNLIQLILILFLFSGKSLPGAQK